MRLGLGKRGVHRSLKKLKEFYFRKRTRVIEFFISPLFSQTRRQTTRATSPLRGLANAGRGTKNSRRRPKMAAMTVSDGLRVLADQIDREADQYSAKKDPDASLCQWQGN